jgi:hypothetical protein
MTDSSLARIEETAELLRTAARAANMVITGDDRISEADAAALLGYAPDTLARKRQAGTGPAAYGMGFAGCRVSYRIVDLAEWIEAAVKYFLTTGINRD